MRKLLVIGVLLGGLLFAACQGRSDESPAPKPEPTVVPAARDRSWPPSAEAEFWRGFTKTAGDRFERECVLSIVEGAFPAAADFVAAPETDRDIIARDIAAECAS